MVAAIAVGLPVIWLARRFGLTSLGFFVTGGALLALACIAWFAREDIASGPVR